MELFQKSDTYTKRELTGFTEIVTEKLHALPDPVITGIGYTAGIVFSWLLVLFGGLVSPDITTAADYGENTAANYFFQSFLFPLLLSFLWPSLSDLLSSFSRSKIDSAGNGFFIGCAASLAALSLGIWGIYHNTSFLFVLLNGIILFIFALYKLNSQYRVENEEISKSPFSEDDASDDFDDSQKNSNFDLSDEDLEI